MKLKEGAVLYHGSYCAVLEPCLEKCAKFKDFGQGFYLTSSKEQAISFSKISARKAKASGIIPQEQKNAYISYYEVTDLCGLEKYFFENADVDWLHSVVAYRRKNIFEEYRLNLDHFDIIGGKIANDDTNATILAYMSNLYGKLGSPEADKICISLLLPDRLQDQFAFKSEKALSRLKFLRSEEVTLELEW